MWIKFIHIKKDRNNPVAIEKHIKNVKAFIVMLAFGDLENTIKLSIFLKYFYEEIIKEVKFEPGYDKENITIYYMGQILVKLWESESKLNTLTLWITKKSLCLKRFIKSLPIKMSRTLKNIDRRNRLYKRRKPTNSRWRKYVLRFDLFWDGIDQGTEIRNRKKSEM